MNGSLQHDWKGHIAADAVGKLAAWFTQDPIVPDSNNMMSTKTKNIGRCVTRIGDVPSRLREVQVDEQHCEHTDRSVKHEGARRLTKVAVG